MRQQNTCFTITRIKNGDAEWRIPILYKLLVQIVQVRSIVTDKDYRLKLKHAVRGIT